MKRRLANFLFALVLILLGNQVIAQSTVDYDSLVSQGNGQLQMGSNENALALANRATKVSAARWEAYAVAGGALLNLKRYEEAADQFSHAIDRAPDAKKQGLRDLRKQCLLAESGESSGSVSHSPSAATPTTQAEIVLWKSIERSTNAADFQGYLQQYPNGAFALLARNRFNDLRNGTHTEGPSPTLSVQIVVKDPAEFHAYKNATLENDPRAKATACESFLSTYPQSVVKGAVLDQLVDAYYALSDMDNTLSAAGRLLEVDPNSLKGFLYSVQIKKQQCAKTSDAQVCDAAAGLALKGLQVTRPASASDSDWAKQTHVAYPIFHSTIALDDAVSKKDYMGAQGEYTAELHLYTQLESQTTGLADSLMLAQAYSSSSSAQNLPEAVWFYARVWDFAPPSYKTQIEPKLEYYYKKYHGSLDGLDNLKRQAQASTFPPVSFHIDPAKNPADVIHDLVAATADLTALALDDKETILAQGNQDDADKVWARLNGNTISTPGTVIEASPLQIKVAVSQDAKSAGAADFVVNLTKPLSDTDLLLYHRGFEFRQKPAAELVGTIASYTKFPATDTTAPRVQLILEGGDVIPAR